MSRLKTTSLAALAVTALTAPHPASAAVQQAQDFFIGNGATGPFTLSWKHILPGTASVTVNNAPVSWGVDYTVDADAGTLTFTHPLPAQAAAIIHYNYDTTQAQAQSGGFSLPMTYAFNENLSLSGAYSRAGASSTDPGSFNMGLSGNWQAANGDKLTTHLLFAPAMTNSDAAAAPNGLARLGLAASGQTQLGKPLLVTFGFSRAGQGVGSQGGSDWQVGMQKLNLGATFTPTKVVQATFGYQQTDPTQSGQGAALSQLNAALALTPSDKLHLQTSLTQAVGGGNGTVQTLAASAALKPSDKTELDAAFTQKDASNSASDDQNINLKAALTEKNLSLTASAVQDTAGPAGTKQTLSAAITDKPTSKSELDASFTQTDAPGTDNDTQNLNVKASVNPTKALALSASLAQSSQGAQDTDTQTVGLSLTPKPTVQVSTNLSVQHTPTANTQVTGLTGKAQPWAFLMVTGGYQWRTAEANQPGAAVNDFDSSTAQVTLAPPKAAVHLVGTYAQNPTDTSGNLQHQAQHGLSLETTVGALKLTTGYTWTQLYATATTGTSLHIGVGLRVSGNTQFTGDYKQDLTGLGLDPTGTTAYSVGLTRNLGDAFALSLTGSVLQNVAPTTATPTPSNVTANASLGMSF